MGEIFFRKLLESRNESLAITLLDCLLVGSVFCTTGKSVVDNSKENGEEGKSNRAQNKICETVVYAGKSKVGANCGNITPV